MCYGKSTMKKTNNGFTRKLLSVIGIVVCVLLVPILIMNLTIVIKSYINPDKVPDFFGIKPIVVGVDSMEPEIPSGALVIAKTIDPTKLKAEDVIAFKEDGSIIIHRIKELIIKDGEPVFATKGDAINVNDENLVAYSQVEGICLFKINRLGSLALFMQTPVGMLVFVGIPMCGFIIYDIVRRRFDNQREKATDNEAQAEIERLRAELAAKDDQSD